MSKKLRDYFGILTLPISILLGVFFLNVISYPDTQGNRQFEGLGFYTLLFSLFFLFSNIIWAYFVYGTSNTSKEKKGRRFISYPLNNFSFWTIVALVINSFGFITNTDGYLLSLFIMFALLIILNINLGTESYQRNHLVMYVVTICYSFIGFLLYPFYVFFFYIKLAHRFFIKLAKKIFRSKGKFGTRTDLLSGSLILKSIVVFILMLFVLLPIIQSVLNNLYSANSSFESINMVEKAFDILWFPFSFLFSLFSGKNLLDIFLILVFSYFFAWIFSFFILKGFLGKSLDKLSKDIKNSGDVIQTSFYTAILLTLFILNFAYIFFIAIDLSTDFSIKSTSIVKLGYSSYSQVAVEGVWQLIYVGAINIVLVYIVLSPFKRFHKIRKLSLNIHSLSGIINKQNTQLRKVGLLFYVFNLVVMFISTLLLTYAVFRRVWAYVEVYGLTDVRLFVLSFMPIFILVITLIFGRFVIQKSYKLVNIAVLSVILFISIYVFLPTSLISARLNISLRKMNIVKEYDPFYAMTIVSEYDFSEYIKSQNIDFPVIQFKDTYLKDDREIVYGERLEDPSDILNLCAETDINDLTPEDSSVLEDRRELLFFQKHFISVPDEGLCTVPLSNTPLININRSSFIEVSSSSVKSSDGLLLIPLILKNQKELRLTKNEVILLEYLLEKKNSYKLKETRKGFIDFNILRFYYKD